MHEIVAAVLAGLGGGATVAVGLSSWLGTIWASRILKSEEVRHIQELENLKSQLQLQLDLAKWPISREDALAADFRKTVENVMLPLMSALHSMCWLTWLAEVAPEEITDGRIDSDDAELHELLPRINGYLTLLAAHDSATYEKLRSHVDDIWQLDLEIGQACQHVKRARRTNDGMEGEHMKSLHECLDKSSELHRSIADDVANLVKDAISRRAHEVMGRFPASSSVRQ